MRLPVAREGIPFIVLAAAVAGLLWWPASSGPGLWAVLAALATVNLLFVIYFFRDPERTGPEGLGEVVSPGDGRILDVSTVDEPLVFQGAAQRISIFLSVFNVHVQRAPVAGTVDHYAYHPGAYAVAWKDKASSDNEHASLGIRHASGPVLVKQIAGLVARRIVTYPRVGATLERGDRIGLIRFGSRVELYLPADWTITCEPGDRVAGGTTVLGRLPAPAEVGSAALEGTSDE